MAHFCSSSSSSICHFLILIFFLFFSGHLLVKADVTAPRPSNADQPTCDPSKNSVPSSSDTPKNVSITYQNVALSPQEKPLSADQQLGAHLFEVVWPPSFGRLYTGIHFYRYGVGCQLREDFFARNGINREVLMKPDPFEDPAGAATPGTLPPWMLAIWMPANYSMAQWARRTAHRGAPPTPLPDELCWALVTTYGRLWFNAAVGRWRDPDTGETIHLNLRLFRWLWEKVNRHGCALRYPHEYFRQGLRLLTEGHLLLGRWLAAAGILPNDHRPYPRADIERALMGAGQMPFGSFRLICADLNWAEYVLTPPEARHFIYPDHGPPSMLYSVIVCVASTWDPSLQSIDPPTFVRCPERMPLLGEHWGFAPCREAQLWYYRTLNDGIDTPLH